MTYTQPNFLDSHENSSSWLSGEEETHGLANSSLSTQSRLGNNAAAGNVERALCNEIAEIFPLLQSLIDVKPSSSFTRRGSVVHTKTPSLSKKIPDSRGRNADQAIADRKKKVSRDKEQGKNGKTNQDGDNVGILSSRKMGAESEELAVLRKQVAELQQKLSEKEELSKSAEVSKNELASVHAKIDELKRLTAEKDSVIKSVQQQLSDSKIKLADRQAALEKLQWEASQSNQKMEKLQGELDSRQGEVLSFMHLFEDMVKDSSTCSSGDMDIVPYQFDDFPYTDDLDEKEMQKLQEAINGYAAAVAMVKEKQDEESFATAAEAKLHLLSFLRANNISEINDNLVLEF